MYKPSKKTSIIAGIVFAVGVATTPYIRARFFVHNTKTGDIRLASDGSEISHAATDLPTITDTNYAVPSGALFVATNGNDSNTGTQNSPLATLGQAISKVASGGTVVLRGGVYREGTLNSDGTTNTPLRNETKSVTIQAYPHEQVWLDGSQVVTGWTQVGSNWRIDNSPSRYLCKPSTDACVLDPSQVDGTNGPMAASPQMVFRNGTPLNEVSSAGTVGAGKFYFDQATNQLTIGDDPSGSTIEVTAQRRALNFTSSSGGSQLLGIGIRRYGSILNSSSVNGGVNGDYAFAMMTASSANLKIENCLFTQSASRGIDITSGSNSTLIQKNVFIANGANGADSDNLSGLTFTSNSVTNNNTENFAITDGASAVIAGSKMTRLTSSTISGNTFSSNNGTGFWCDLSCNNVTIVSNSVSHNNKHGIYYEVSSNGIIANNTIFKNSTYGIKNSSDNTRIYNNTLTRNHQAILIYHDTRQAISGVTVKNNIFANNDGSSAALFDTQQSTSEGVDEFFASLDYNAYQRDSAATPPNLVKWCHKGSSCSTNYTSFSTFKSATGMEPHGIGIDQTNPFFVSESSDNYKLRNGVPAAGSGVALPSDIASAIGAPAGTVSMGALPWPAITPPPPPPLPPQPPPPPTSDKKTSNTSNSNKISTTNGSSIKLASPIPCSEAKKNEVLVDGRVIASSTNCQVPAIDTSTLSNGNHIATVCAYKHDGQKICSNTTVTVNNHLNPIEKFRNWLFRSWAGRSGRILNIALAGVATSIPALGFAIYKRQYLLELARNTIKNVSSLYSGLMNRA